MSREDLIGLDVANCITMIDNVYSSFQVIKDNINKELAKNRDVEDYKTIEYYKSLSKRIDKINHQKSRLDDVLRSKVDHLVLNDVVDLLNGGK